MTIKFLNRRSYVWHLTKQPLRLVYSNIYPEGVVMTSEAFYAYKTVSSGLELQTSVSALIECDIQALTDFELLSLEDFSGLLVYI